MRNYSLRLTIVVAATLAPSFAGAQHEAHQTGSSQTSSAELSQCLRVQPVIQNIITAATARVEAARLSNSPAEMRAAVDHLKAALRDIRAQLAPCSAASGTTDPHAGHAMPGTQQPAAGGGPAAQSPAGAANAHAAHASGQPDGGDVKSWLKGYDAAFVAKDLDKLATFYHPDVTIFEGGGVNRGWADYRDNHLGPEFKEFQNLQFSHTNVVVRILGPDAAYVSGEYVIKGRMGDREVDSSGLATLVLVRATGAWKIRHSHTSTRRRAAAAGGPGRPPAS